MYTPVLRRPLQEEHRDVLNEVFKDLSIPLQYAVLLVAELIIFSKQPLANEPVL